MTDNSVLIYSEKTSKTLAKSAIVKKKCIILQKMSLYSFQAT